MKQRRALIIGAGPAGLSAAYELLKRTDIKPIVLEKTDSSGGASRNVLYKGNTVDIGGHRFFSKSDRVRQTWVELLPVHESENELDDEVPDDVMLTRRTRSKIFFARKFFDYPVKLSIKTFRRLGLRRAVRIVFSYLRSQLFPLEEKNLEDFFINRFGRELYETFFKSYTEKACGARCSDISADWGEPMVGGLSIGKSIVELLKRLILRNIDAASTDTEISMIDAFLYPKFGPGQMWDVVADKVKSGGEILLNTEAISINTEGNRVIEVVALNTLTGEKKAFDADFYISTMPIKDLVAGLNPGLPPDISEIGRGLIYRDFIIVCLLLEDLGGDSSTDNYDLTGSNYIYIQEPNVLAGRMQIFNNWSPYLVADRSKAWIGLEYFCFETDDIWKMDDNSLIELARKELGDLGFAREDDYIDGTVIRLPKAYPSYFGTYERFQDLREQLDKYSNLYLIGRNGTHKYLSQYHSVLGAMRVVDIVHEGIGDKSRIWAINTKEEYPEEEGLLDRL